MENCDFGCCGDNHAIYFVIEEHDKKKSERKDNDYWQNIEF